ncbi:hypothetical protein DTO166G4_2401 [Paecilomyces variotii]|nr:hypothetical protein DTO166G4_2401 [Paecilomyces variotii]KAJ9228583.1 hypothetical protein DTO169E5_9146 [Paecilomyces variotii]KAJ9256724.1 hypothetical protein DTO195F2_5810 [Paecilomyces variotii]KAJ9348313.1 hypothetical protein DTO027B9_8427 [Paecilomyces variotii]KAJ9393157.1 hypothetical protein DTO063F5_294 [Paecilomyces variotii]
MAENTYCMADVLAIASIHPFYSNNTYPPSSEELPTILERQRESPKDLKLSSFPLTRKDTLYKEIARLTTDCDPRNGYRRGTYISTTGGGSASGFPMVFATDSIENRQQRAVFGSFLRSCGIVGPGDWVLTMHSAGQLYRALDLMAEVFEGSGATVLCAGNEMEQGQIVQTIIQYRVNAISGDAGQITQLARYVSTLTEEKRKQLAIDKALYTSEPMTPSQRRFLKSVFPNIAVSSVIGSAEAGPWGASPVELTELSTDQNYADFVFDDRLIHLEVFPFSIEDLNKPSNGDFQPVPDGEKGLLVQTSLQRLRNPLVRYVCGDVCSLHSLSSIIKDRISSEDAAHYRIARIYGRDRRISFDWYGEYFEFCQVQEKMRTESWGILQYQVIRRYREGDQNHLNIVLELRLLRDCGPGKISEKEITQELRTFFRVFENNEELFDLKYLPDYGGFHRSATGRKVVNFLDLTQK